MSTRTEFERLLIAKPPDPSKAPTRLCRSVEGAGWEMLFVAIDDHARIAFTAMHADERTAARCSSCATRWRNTPGWASRSDGCLQTTARRSDQESSPRPARSSASVIASRDRTGRRPTARPNASSSPRCASGPTDSPTSAQPSEPPRCSVGTTTTTGTDHIKALAAPFPYLDFAQTETIS